MRAVHHTESGVSVADADLDTTGRDDWIEIDVRAAGICGSDLHLMEWGPLAVTPGHEVSGVTPDGTAVAIEPNVYCNDCDQCRAGNTHYCPDVGIIGIGLPGGMADRVLAPERCLVPLRPGSDVSTANLVEPLGVAVHGLHRAGLEPGSRVAVVGGGSIGLSAAAVALASGCDVDVEARHPHQQVAAEQLGAGIGTGTGYDLVVDGAGTSSSLAACVDLAPMGGTIAVLGTYWGEMTAPGLPFTGKELTLVAGFAYCAHGGRRDIDRAAVLLAERPEIADALITHRFGLDDAAEAFRVAADRAAGAIKVVVEP